MIPSLRRRLIAMDEGKFAWTALPPLPLYGLASELVESIDYYTLRMSWTTGWSLSQLMGLLTASHGGRGSGERLRFYRTDDEAESLVLALQRLANAPQLRCGTLLTLKNIIGRKAAAGFSGPARRWCPLCYKHWDLATDWEPLVWSIPYVSRCPIHRCMLSCKCPQCGAKQSRDRAIRVRRICSRCKASLSGDGSFAEQSKLLAWVETQIFSLVKFCADPNRQVLPTEALSELMSGLKTKANGRSRIDLLGTAVNWSNSGAGPNPLSIRALLNLSAFQGVPVVDLITRPREAMQAPLLDLWQGSHWISSPFAGNDDPVKPARWLVRRLLGDKSLRYVPPISVLAKDSGVSLIQLREFDPEAYARYINAYQTQCSLSLRQARERAFLVARRRLENLDIFGRTHHDFWWLPSEIEKKAHVDESDAKVAFYAALVYVRLLTRVLKHSEKLFSATNDSRWIESAPPLAQFVDARDEKRS